jgi:hypothetical protein
LIGDKEEPLPYPKIKVIVEIVGLLLLLPIAKAVSSSIMDITKK